MDRPHSYVNFVWKGALYAYCRSGLVSLQASLSSDEPPRGCHRARCDPSQRGRPARIGLQDPTVRRFCPASPGGHRDERWSAAGLAPREWIHCLRHSAQKRSERPRGSQSDQKLLPASEAAVSSARTRPNRQTVRYTCVARSCVRPSDLGHIAVHTTSRSSESSATAPGAASKRLALTHPPPAEPRTGGSDQS